MSFNRNIITKDDAANFVGARETGGPLPVTLADSPPAISTSAQTPSADDYLTKLLKYVPPEVVGFYLFVSTLIVQNQAQGSTSRSVWLLILLVLAVTAACLYDHFVLGIKRLRQIVMTAIGFVVYVFAIGGWFATTTWYHPWYGTGALALFAIAVAMLKLAPLPAGAG